MNALLATPTEGMDVTRSYFLLWRPRWRIEQRGTTFVILRRGWLRWHQMGRNDFSFCPPLWQPIECMSETQARDALEICMRDEATRTLRKRHRRVVFER